jgi:uncharacterized phage protein (TIGR01671 family)
MREIKFRAWIPEWKRYVFEEDPDFKVRIYADGEVEYLRIDSGESWPITAIIEFYTGLKDKHGKEIYEGDIVEGYDSKAVIIYDAPEYGEGICGFIPKFIEGNGEEWWWSKERWFRWEIIGNIHEEQDK